jgi:hypothetical protein
VIPVSTLLRETTNSHESTRKIRNPRPTIRSLSSYRSLRHSETKSGFSQGLYLGEKVQLLLFIDPEKNIDFLLSLCKNLISRR